MGNAVYNLPSSCPRSVTKTLPFGDVIIALNDLVEACWD